MTFVFFSGFLKILTLRATFSGSVVLQCVREYSLFADKQRCDSQRTPRLFFSIGVYWWA